MEMVVLNRPWFIKFEECFLKDVCFCTFLHAICLEDLLGMSLGGLRCLFTDSIIWASEADQENVILSILHIGVHVISRPNLQWTERGRIKPAL